MNTAIKRVPAPLAWPYTTGEKFMQIAESGLLLPATAGVVPPERPVVWFSLNQRFEPTASKGIVTPDGKRRNATLEEMREFGGNLVRFGIAPRELLTGEALRRQARINRQTWASLCSSGRRQGADPGLWFGSLEPVWLERLTVEVMDDAGHWETVRPAAGHLYQKAA